LGPLAEDRKEYPGAKAHLAAGRDAKAEALAYLRSKGKGKGKGNDKDKSEMRGFFAALRMTVVSE
jgi:hypothetical protein